MPGVADDDGNGRSRATRNDRGCHGHESDPFPFFDDLRVAPATRCVPAAVLELLRHDGGIARARCEGSAARRFGAPLGEEFNIGIDWEIMLNWRFWATAAVFYPMRYYATAGLINDAPQGNTKAVAFQMGMELTF